MVISRRKRRENKEISVYMNNKLLEEVQKIKYLGIIFDVKLNFREHIMYISNKCTKLIHALSKSAKQRWGLATQLSTPYTKEQFCHYCYTELRYGSMHWTRKATKQFTTEYSAL
jgi:hypothetical protein